MRFSENGGCHVRTIANDVDKLVRLLTASSVPVVNVQNDYSRLTSKKNNNYSASVYNASCSQVNLVPRPLPVFLRVTLKNRVWPRDKATDTSLLHTHYHIIGDGQ